MPSSQTNGIGAGRPPKARIVILGGGFGGLTTARHVERLFKLRKDVEIILVSRDNFLVMTPLLFEVCSGARRPPLLFPDSRVLADHALRRSPGPRRSTWSAAWFISAAVENRVNWPTTSSSSPLAG